MDDSSDSDVDKPLISMVRPPQVRRGDRVEVYWNERDYEGWYPGSVEVISDGTTDAPNGKRRKVDQGHSIVDYGQGPDG